MSSDVGEGAEDGLVASEALRGRGGGGTAESWQ